VNYKERRFVLSESNQAVEVTVVAIAKASLVRCTQHDYLKADAARWSKLEFVGYQVTKADAFGPREVLELRNCSCGSTLAVELHGEKADAAAEAAVRSLVRRLYPKTFPLGCNCSNGGDAIDCECQEIEERVREDLGVPRMGALS
jgi:hypothetical protein